MSDLISRRAAIDAILAVTGNSSVRELYEHVQEHGLSDMWSGGVNAAIDIIIAVPSAQTNLDHIYAELSKAYNVPGLPKEAIGIIGDLMVSLDEPPIQPTEEFQWCDDCNKRGEQDV